MKTKTFLSVLATLVLSAILLPASAAKTHAHPKVSMAQAKAIVKKTVPGRFKSSELENENGKSIFRSTFKPRTACTK